jgi:hypothetical protein
MQVTTWILALILIPKQHERDTFAFEFLLMRLEEVLDNQRDIYRKLGLVLPG